MPFKLFPFWAFFICVVDILNEPWKIPQQQRERDLSFTFSKTCKQFQDASKK